MPAVCFYFEVHQPYRVNGQSLSDSTTDYNPALLFDEKKNSEVLRKVAAKCYLPMNALLLSMIKKWEGKFRIAFSITGTALDQMQEYCPEVIASFQDLAKTGAVEFLAETYYHSLSALFEPKEFAAQVAKHTEKIQELFHVTPTVFRNTELIYNDQIGSYIEALGYKGAIAEGADDILGWRSPHFVYRRPGGNLPLLLKSYKLSDDIAFRFSNRGWAAYPLKAETYAGWLHAVSGNGETVNLFMDYETFGEHQWEDTGIFEFMEHLPAQVLAHPDWEFLTPSQVIDRFEPKAELSYPRTTSWADTERDITAWYGNQMQKGALQRIYDLGNEVKALNDAELLHTWRKLQTSDHFYYLCTKWFADGDVHAYFSPFESPYEAYIAYMSCVRVFEREVIGRRKVQVPVGESDKLLM